MADYLEAYADHHRMPVETGIRVDRLRASNEADGAGGYSILAGDRRYEANQVVIATGGFHDPMSPISLADSIPASASSTRPPTAVPASSPTVRCWSWA